MPKLNADECKALRRSRSQPVRISLASSRTVVRGLIKPSRVYRCSKITMKAQIYSVVSISRNSSITRVTVPPTLVHEFVVSHQRSGVESHSIHAVDYKNIRFFLYSGGYDEARRKFCR